ncbi:uncharacterized protein LOC124637222 [Helicoverpa zea]|uniref:uncharacterized protein LOC124637222 n=1 Tax=Helicoverpa zea TaxID=7113 RepID=UPI001F5856C0|nr:uncharacterized protein LOC124637222 [Helicoverpa zea]
MKAGINRIYCNNCEEEETDEDEPDVEEKTHDLQKILKDIQKKVGAIPELKKHLDVIKQSISLLSDKYDTLIKEHELTKDKIAKLEKSSVNITNRCVYLEKCNLALEQKLNEYEQSSRKHNIEIVGVEYLPGENVKDIVTKIGDELGVNSQDIEWAKRSRLVKPGTKPSSIIIGFKASGAEDRNKWLEKRRQIFEKRITSNMIIPGGSMNNRIYINEDLIPTTRALLWNAKKQLHGIYKYIWVSNGKILAKKAEGEKTIWIRDQSDLNDILK